MDGTVLAQRLDQLDLAVGQVDEADPDALRGQVAPNAVPSTLVLDTEGRVAARVSGAADPSVLRAMIDAVVAE